MSDQYTWWRQALKLAGDCRELTRDQIRMLGASESDPQSGFFRRRRYKDAPFIPVAIWFQDGKLVCLDGGKSASEPHAVWVSCLRHPVTEATYRAVLDSGEAWPDEPPAPPKDHNQVKTGDAAVDLEAEFKAEMETATTFLKKPVETQEQADKIAVWAKKVAEIKTKADAEFDVEKKPIREEAKRVDDRWRFRQDIESFAKLLKRSLDSWLKELGRREAERQRLAREEADKLKREAEAKAREAEKAKTLQEGGVATLFAEEVNREAEALAEKARRADQEAAARSVSAGRTGAKVSLRTYYVHEITDYDALLMALKDEPEVREAVDKIAARIARTAGAPVPAGMKRVEDRKAA